MRQFTVIGILALVLVSGCATSGYQPIGLLPAGVSGAEVVEYNRGVVTPVQVSPVYVYPDPRDQAVIWNTQMQRRDQWHENAMDHERIRLQRERQQAHDADRLRNDQLRALKTVSDEAQEWAKLKARADQAAREDALEAAEVRRDVQSVPRQVRPSSYGSSRSVTKSPPPVRREAAPTVKRAPRASAPVRPSASTRSSQPSTRQR